jgi:hypothetical protein
MVNINPVAMARYHAKAEKWETLRAAWFTMQNKRTEALACNAKITRHRSIHRAMLLKIQKQKQKLEATV